MKSKYTKIIPLRLTEALYKDLRKISYLTEVPMAEIVREAIEIKLINSKKVLTNSDIAI